MKKEEINIVAFIAPTPSFIDLNACGEYNGYVAIPSTHIAYGVRYDDELFDNIRVHGGLTYCGYATYNEKDAFGRYVREEYIGKRNGLFKKAEVIQALDGQYSYRHLEMKVGMLFQTDIISLVLIHVILMIIV